MVAVNVSYTIQPLCKHPGSSQGFHDEMPSPPPSLSTKAMPQTPSWIQQDAPKMLLEAHLNLSWRSTGRGLEMTGGPKPPMV